MEFFGDIKQLHGDTLSPVDVVVGGSPCQDYNGQLVRWDRHVPDDLAEAWRNVSLDERDR
jgi:site-specific DNA-cytosine methylase